MNRSERVAAAQALAARIAPPLDAPGEARVAALVTDFVSISDPALAPDPQLAADAFVAVGHLTDGEKWHLFHQLATIPNARQLLDTMAEIMDALDVDAETETP